MSDDTAMLCKQMKQLAVLYACDELDAPARSIVEEHAAACPACAALLERERELLAAVTAQPVEEPSAVLLMQCRGDLSDAMDELSPKSFAQRVVEFFRPRRWMTLDPAWGAVFFLLLGVTLGVGIPRWLEFSGETEPVEAVSAIVPASEQDYQDLAVSRINVLPASEYSDASVEVQGRREQPIVLRGNVDNQELRSMLLHVAQSRRFDSGLRMDSLEALRLRAKDDQEVRRAFCEVARQDANPGVRLKAIEALRGFSHDPAVRQTLLDVLNTDSNAGVRIEAINTLRTMMESSPGADEQLLHVLRDRMQNDPNTYIRLQSAAAVRDLSPRPKY